MSEQDLDSEGTYSFDPRDRGDMVDKMKEYGYVELKGYIGTDPNDPYIPFAYNCGNCRSMNKDPRSATGYWCKKFGFPDRPEGCCDGFAPKSDKLPPRPGESGLKFVGGDTP